MGKETQLIMGLGSSTRQRARGEAYNEMGFHVRAEKETVTAKRAMAVGQGFTFMFLSKYAACCLEEAACQRTLPVDATPQREHLSD